MKTFLATFCLVALVSTQLLAQKRKDNIFFCGYGDNQNAKELCNYLQIKAMVANQDAEDAVDKILSPLGLPRNFVLVSCPNIKNAVAVTPTDGMRYIVYDLEFMKSIDQTTTNWSSASILAHEIGHHLCGHTLVGATDLADSRKKELEADEFSGFVLFKMGATLHQAQAAVISIVNDNDDSFSTHPKRSKRMDAIEKGFNKAQAQQPPVKVADIPNVEYFIGKANKARQEKLHQLAIDNFTAAIAIDPNCYSAYNSRGCTKADLGDEKGAMDDFAKAVQIDPKYGFGYLNLALCYQKNAENAQDERAIQEYYSKALANFNKSVEVDKSYAPTFYCRAKLKVVAWEDFKGAIPDYDQAIELEPDNHPDYYCDRGLSKGNLGDEKGAMDDFAKAVQIDPKFAFGYFNLAQGNARKGAEAEEKTVGLSYYSKALELYNKSIKLDQSFDGAFFYRAEVKIDGWKDYKGAIADYSQALQLEQNNDKAYYKRAIAKKAIEDYPGALADLNRAIELNSEDGNYFGERGEIKLYKLHDEKGAIADLSKLIELYDKSYLAYYHRGIAKANLEDLEGGIQDLNYSILLNDQFPLPHYFKGLMLYDINSVEEACKSLQNAANLGLPEARDRIKELCK